MIQLITRLEREVYTEHITTAARILVVVHTRGQAFLNIHLGIVTAITGQQPKVRTGEIDTQTLDTGLLREARRQRITDRNIRQTEERAILYEIRAGDILLYILRSPQEVSLILVNVVVVLIDLIYVALVNINGVFRETA